jgi:type I restriction enzyme S subunit
MALINIIHLSEIENFKDLSPDFYKAEYMSKSASIRKNKFRRLSQISFITDGEHGSPCWSDNSGIKYVTAEFIKENFIEQGITKQITIDQDRRNARARLKEGDLLIYSVGAYAGLTCVAEAHLFPANIPRSVAIVRLNNNDEFYPEFVSVFLNSSIGKFQSIRFRAGNSQPVLALEKIRQFEVPIFDERIQREIKILYQEAYKLRQKSQALYKQANDLLKQELGLEKIKINNKNYFTTLNTTCVTERIIDPKFHNPKFEQINNHLKANFETIELRKIADVEYGYMPMQDYEKDKTKGIPLIRVTNITQEIEIKMDDLKYIPNWVKVPSKKYVEKGDILIVQCGDTTGKVGYIYEDVKNHLFPSFCFSIKVKDCRINSLFLAALLKSNLMQILFDQTVMINTVRPNTTKPRFEKIIIPIFDMPFQLKIAEMLVNSNNAKKQSQQLLTDAKARVEQLIKEAANNA